jgi:hypothetical protein
LEHASPNIQLDQHIVMEAVKNNIEAFPFAGEALRGNRDIIKWVARKQGQFLRFASQELRADSDLVLEVIHDNWFVAEYVAEPLCYDTEFWKEVIEQDPETGWMAFSYAPMEIRSDPDLVMDAVKIEPMAFKFASDELRADLQFVLEVVKQNWVTLAHASKAARSDPEIVLEAVRQDCDALRYASDELLVDPDFALEATGYQPRALAPGNASLKLQDDRSWVLQAVEANPVALTYIDAKHRTDREVVNKAMSSRLGSCSGLSWKTSPEDSTKWSRGTMALALDELNLGAEPSEKQLVDA